MLLYGSVYAEPRLALIRSMAAYIAHTLADQVRRDTHVLHG